MLNKSQHGFLRDQSCQTNLIYFFGSVTRLVEEGNAVGIVYLDFSKAFDKFPHNILVRKLVGMDKVTIK